MEASQIMEVMKKRRDAFWDRQIVGMASDPLTFSDASVARAIAEEYDSLLAEIENVTSLKAKSA